MRLIAITIYIGSTPYIILASAGSVSAASTKYLCPFAIVNTIATVRRTDLLFNPVHKQPHIPCLPLQLLLTVVWIPGHKHLAMK